MQFGLDERGLITNGYGDDDDGDDDDDDNDDDHDDDHDDDDDDDDWARPKAVLFVVRVLFGVNAERFPSCVRRGLAECAKRLNPHPHRASGMVLNCIFQNPNPTLQTQNPKPDTQTPKTQQFIS